MRANTYHGAPNCERPQETSQDTYSIECKCVLNLSMELLIAKDLKKHRKSTFVIRYKCILNLPWSS